MIWFEAICRSLHVLAAVCWIGGLYVMLRIVRPIILLNTQQDNNFTLIRTIQKKFLVLAGMMLLTVLLTGLGNLYMVIKNFSGATPPMTWMIILSIKLLLAFALFGIYLVNYFSMKSQSIDSKVKPVLYLPKTALIFGFIIIALGIILHTRIVY